jgi:hypothetical protein
MDSPMHMSLEIIVRIQLFIVCIQICILSKQKFIVCVTNKENNFLAFEIRWMHNSHWGSHSSVAEELSFLGCDTVLLESSSQ